jgi:3-oxoacyl-[acyl-carrier-protein] synthase II
MDQEIVITGIGVISNIGFDINSYWENRELGNRKKNEFNFSIMDFKPKEFMKRKLINNLDQISKYCISAVGNALKDSSLNKDNTTIGIVGGSMYHGIFSIFNIKEAFYEGGVDNISPLFFPGTVFNAPTAQASIEWGLTGPNCTINTGMASGLSAIIKGVHYLLLEKADAMICGGSEMIFDFINAKYKDFFHNKDISNGEGACFFVLEGKDNAIKRSVNRYASILSYKQYYCNSEEESRDVILSCIQDVLYVGNINYTDLIDLVIFDGCDNNEHDVIIYETISKFFKGKLPYITSNHISIGNSLGASGAFALLEGILSITNQETILSNYLDNNIDNQKNTSSRVKAKIEKVLVISYDPNGCISCVMLSKS